MRTLRMTRLVREMMSFGMPQKVKNYAYLYKI